MTRVLIVGASGYIGSRLAERLTKRGEQLTLMSRDVRGMAARFPDARVVSADLLDPANPRSAPWKDVEVAYYLAHSMAAGERGFAERDKQAAQAFAQRGGRRRTWGASSTSAAWAKNRHSSPPHLASRQQTGAQLARRACR